MRPLACPCKPAFLALHKQDAQRDMQALRQLYGHYAVEDCDVIVVIGGDGFLLENMHRYLSLDKPFFGMNHGSVGFLMNKFQLDNLPERLAQAESQTLHPLLMDVTTTQGEIACGMAFNEISVCRASRQAAKLEILLENIVRMPELICDGVLVSTPAGSTAYNLSAHGPILPLSANVLALTPISAFRPRRWRGALLPHQSHITIRVLESDKRPVHAVADHMEVTDVAQVSICEDITRQITLLFDKSHSLTERVLGEQFSDL